MTAPTQWHRFDYGRKLDDFVPGAIYQHPFELTVDASIVGPYMASFIDASPITSSTSFAQALGIADRPVPAHLLLNLGLSTSVHDVSQQAIAHLAYVRVDFPKPLRVGATVRGATRVIAAKPTSSSDKGVVHVHTVLVDEAGDRVLDFERKALVRGGQIADRPEVAPIQPASLGAMPTTPTAARLAEADRPTDIFRPALFGTFEDLEPGMRLCHANGRTIADSEHMQLSALCRNSHPLHWDAVYSKEHSFTGERVVYGGLVLAWVLTQTSLDIGGHVAWEGQWSDGAHPAPVLAGDTLFAATEVRSKRQINEWLGEVELRVVGVKNERPEALLAAGKDLFESERRKDKSDRLRNKVVEITRRALVMLK